MRTEDVSFFASVPHYARGYERMFAAPHLAWHEPKIPQFDPKRFPDLLQRLGDACCAAILCWRSEWEEEVPPLGSAYSAALESREKALWIIANRSMQAYAESDTSFGEVKELPIYDDHEITPASKFRVIMVGLPTALYYRDLFVHRLGATTADRGFLLLVDGQVMTAFGIFIQDFLQFRTRYLPEMFGITRSSRRYHRLGKLFMLLLTSGEMKKRLCDILRLWLHEPAGIQTTSITVHEEGKTDRGALRVVSREKLEDGDSASSTFQISGTTASPTWSRIGSKNMVKGGGVPEAAKRRKTKPITPAPPVIELQKILELGNGLELWKVHPSSLREQGTNARSMPKAMFERLSQTIGRDKRLESLPLCARTEKGLEIVSGHHRTRAATAVGLSELFTLVDVTGLTRSQIAAKQLAHNAIEGQDNHQLLAEIYRQIEDAESKLEAFVTRSSTLSCRR